MKWLLCFALAASCGCARTVEHGLEGRIARHSFWRAPVSERQVASMADTACGLSANDFFFVDDQGHFGAAHNDSVDHMVMVEQQQVGILNPPAGVGQPFVCVDMQEFGTRPDRATFLEVLLQRLDRADFARPSR